MDANGRKTFWEALLKAKSYDQQSIEALRDASKPPRLLCRFRSVSENSLLQLQENKLYFSSADYYDDPFDTYFYIDLSCLVHFYDTVKPLLEAKDPSVKQIVDAASLLTQQSPEVFENAISNRSPNFIKLREELDDIRINIQKQLFSICFCEDPFNETLWLKYADNHKGFVQIYDVESDDTYLCGKSEECKDCFAASQSPYLYPVYYSDERYNATNYVLATGLLSKVQNGNISLPKEAVRIIEKQIAWELERITLIKKKCHEYDQEWRMIRPQMMPARTYIKMKPLCIITGLRMPKYQQKLVYSAASIAGIKHIHEMYIDGNDRLDGRPIKED